MSDISQISNINQEIIPLIQHMRDRIKLLEDKLAKTEEKLAKIENKNHPRVYIPNYDSNVNFRDQYQHYY